MSVKVPSLSYYFCMISFVTVAITCKKPAEKYAGANYVLNAAAC